MARKKKHPEHVNHERWLISYADFITLLFAFFVVMFAVSRVDTNKMGRFSESFSKAVGIEALSTAGSGILPGEGAVMPPIAGSGDGDGDATGNELEGLKKALTQKSENGEDSLKALEIIAVRNELVLRFPVGVVFDSGNDDIKEAALPALMAIAKEVASRPVELRVEGHTDDKPIHTVRFRSNWDLSACRATAVVSELAKSGGIEPPRLSAAGYGEFHPLASNATPEGRAKNRRVDIVVRVAVKDPGYTGKSPGDAPSKPETKDGSKTQAKDPATKEEPTKDEHAKDPKGEAAHETAHADSAHAEPAHGPAHAKEPGETHEAHH